MAKQVKMEGTKHLTHPTGKITSGSATYANTLTHYKAAGRVIHEGTLADGTAVTVAHVVRRRYVVFGKDGKALGYLTAADPANVVNRVEGNTLATLKLH